MIYHVKTFPILISNYKDLIESINDVRSDVTHDFHLEELTSQYENFIKGLPVKIN